MSSKSHEEKKRDNDRRDTEEQIGHRVRNCPYARFIESTQPRLYRETV